MKRLLLTLLILASIPSNASSKVKILDVDFVGSKVIFWTTEGQFSFILTPSEMKELYTNEGQDKMVEQIMKLYSKTIQPLKDPNL